MNLPTANRILLVAISSFLLALIAISLAVCGVVHKEDVTERKREALELLEKGLELEKRGSIEKAKEVYKHALRLDPKLDDVKWRLAHVEGKLGNWNAAVSLLEDLSKSHPKDVRVLSALTEAYIQSGQCERAASVARKVVSLRPKGLKERLILVEALSNCGKVDEAAAHLRIAAHISPHDPEIHFQLGRYYCKRSLWKEALYHLRMAKRLAPTEPQPRLLMAKAYFELGRLDEAATELKGLVELAPNDVGLLYDCARLLFEAGRLNEAIAHYRRLLHIAPYHNPARRELIDAYVKANSYRDAIHHIRLMLRTQPNDAKLNEALAICLLRLGRLKEAIPILQRLLKMRCGDATVHVELARAYEKLGDIKLAHRHYEDAVMVAFSTRSQASVDEKLALISEAIEFALRANDHHTLIKLCERAIRIAPNDMRWRLFRARSLIEIGKLRSATLSLQAILRKFEGCHEAKLMLGFIRAWRFEWKDAEQLLLEALDGLPNNADIAEALLTIYLCQGRKDEALKLIDRCKNGGMDEISLALLKSHAYEVLGNAKLTTKALTETKAFERGEPRLLLQLARVYLLEGLYEPAIKRYRQLVELASKGRNRMLELQFRSELAEALFQAGDYDGAAFELKRAIMLSPKDDRLRMRHAMVLLRLNRISDAFMAARNANEVCGAADVSERFASMIYEWMKGSVDASLNAWIEVWKKVPSRFVADVGIELLRGRKILSEHVKALEGALLESGGKSPLQRRMAFEVLAWAYMSANMHEEAIGIWRRLCTLSPNDASYWAGFAEACIGVGDISGAIANFERAIRITPFANEVRERYVRFLMECGRVEEAYMKCCIWLSLGEQSEQAYSLLIECAQLLGQERLREIVKGLSKMAMKKPDDLALACGVAEGYERLGDYKRALPYWRRACGLTKASLKYVERLASCLERAGYSEWANWARCFIVLEERRSIFGAKRW